MKKIFKLLLLSLLITFLVITLSISGSAEEMDVSGIDASQVSDESRSGVGFFGNSDVMETLISLTLISLVPTILVMTTCFTRIIIVLSLLRNAIGLQQTPPNQVLIGIALFLSLFIMSPTWTQINDSAFKPYQADEINEEQFIENAMEPLRDFMFKNTKNEDLNFFLSINGSERPEELSKISSLTLIPAFVTSELKRAFIIGFMLYLPFLIIDIVVASTLMSMGMVMLPPTVISMPFKLMLFVLVDGWQLTFQTLVTGFN